MARAAHRNDPAPFNLLMESKNGLLDNLSQLVVFRFRVWRFWLFSGFNTIYPVWAVAVLATFVFWIPEDDLAARVEVVAALFLSLVGERWLLTARLPCIARGCRQICKDSACCQRCWGRGCRRAGWARLG